MPETIIFCRTDVNQWTTFVLKYLTFHFAHMRVNWRDRVELPIKMLFAKAIKTIHQILE